MTSKNLAWRLERLEADILPAEEKVIVLQIQGNQSRRGLEGNDARPTRLPRGRRVIAATPHHISTPEAQLLLRVRTGALPYKEAAELLERGLERLEECQKLSKLPATADVSEAEKFVAAAYACEVLKAA